MIDSLTVGASETIVVVDDQPVVLEFCRVTLERAGYNVFTATNGEQALSFFEPNRSPVDLAVIDIVMPGMSGIELARRLEKLSKGVRIVLMSGYAPDEVRRVVGEQAANYRSMWKPFEARTLVQMIKNALDSEPSKGILASQATQVGS
jgi:two-component system, cell cycle sensor histidine kinase and response regulator CckA